MQTTSSPTRRRRSAFIAVFAAALLALGALALSPAVAHAAPKATKGAEIHTLKENQTYTKYDITGDGRPDSIMVESYYDYYGQSSRFYVNINDSYWAFDTYHYGVTARLVKLANGTPYLFLRAWADNDDAEVCGLYQNKGNRLKRVVDCNKGFGTKIGFHPGGDIKKVSGNSITFSFTQMAYYTGRTYADFTYKYKNGTLKKTSNVGKLQVGFKKAKNTYKALKKIKVYKNTKCKSVKFTIKKGQKVKFLKAYVKGNTVRFQVRAGGKTGWVKLPTSGNSSLMYQGMPPFKGLFLAG